MEQTQTKRKYTVSEKVKAANKRNLEKARAVDKQILYRRTQKRLEAARANLLLARQSPKYKQRVRHGLRAVDLRQSAPQVGETEQEYDRHLELVEGVLPARHGRERNGVRGLAQALWRRRRMFMSRRHLETLGFYLEVEKAALYGLCPASVEDLSFASWELFLEGEDPRLEWIMDRLDKRLVRVAEAYLTEHGQQRVNLGVWGKHYYDIEFLQQPPEVIGNGLVRPGVVKQRMKGKPVDMKRAGLFDWDPGWKEKKSGLLAEWARLGYRLPDPRREEDFALHLRLIEAAFFGDRKAGFNLEPATIQFPVSSLDLRVAKFKAAYPELYQAVREMAEATWQRLQVFSRQGEKEAGELQEVLERAAAGRLEPAEKSLRELWEKVRQKRLDQVPEDPIDKVLGYIFEMAQAKKKAEEAEKQESEEQESEVRSQKN